MIDKVIVKAKKIKDSGAKDDKDIAKVKDERESERILLNESENWLLFNDSTFCLFNYTHSNTQQIFALFQI